MALPILTERGVKRGPRQRPKESETTEVLRCGLHKGQVLEPREPQLGRESPEIFKAGPGDSSRRGGTQGLSDFQRLRPPLAPEPSALPSPLGAQVGEEARPAPRLSLFSPAGLPGQGAARLELKARRCAGSERSRPTSAPHRSGASPGGAGLLPPRPAHPPGRALPAAAPALTLSQKEPRQPAGR
nr:unnamed protein product [Rangifer tarandus platyrhynchus]